MQPALGAPKNGVVSIGTYGCSRGKRNQLYLREGLEAMLSYLRPQVVLVYGAKPRYAFDGLESQTEFARFPDWTTRVKGGRSLDALRSVIGATIESFEGCPLGPGDYYVLTLK